MLGIGLYLINPRRATNFGSNQGWSGKLNIRETTFKSIV
jgi:hypothetical protein